MAKFLLLIISICILYSQTIAQQKNGTIKGIIYDSVNDVPLSSASVIFYKKADSSLQGFQITDYKGEFSVTQLPVKTPMYFVVTFTGYNSYAGNIQLDSSNAVLDLQTINLKTLDSTGLADVVVKSVAPIKMNGDTLEINPDAFKLDSNAVVEDMLLRVPGMVVWSDGTITMNGKKIEKLLVDGKPFFNGRTDIATQNLPKDAIEKIQLYEQKDPNKIEGVDNGKKDSLYSMNIQLKADKKKGIFGKVGAGYGTDKRYDASGVLQGYDPKNQVGIAIGADNTNKSTGIGADAFLQNTFKQSFMFYRYGDPEVSGIKKNLWGTAKFQHSFNETDNGQYYSRLSGDYSYTNTDLNNINKTDQTSNLITYNQRSIANSQSDNSTGTHAANFLYERRSKFADFISINTSANHSNSDNNSTSVNNVYRNDTAISFNDVKNYSKSSSNSVNMTAMINSNGFINPDNLKSYSVFVNAGYNDNNTFTHTDNVFTSYIDSIPSSTIIRNYNNKSDNFNASASLRYNSLRQLIFGIYNLYNIDIGLNNTINFSKSTQNSRVQDFDSLTKKYITNDYLTNNNTLNNFEYTPGLYLSKSINKYVNGKYYSYLFVMASIDHQWINQNNTSTLLYRNINKNYQMWVPGVNMNFSYEKSNQYRIYSYMYGSINPNLPGIDQLVPIIDTTNRYNVTVGNPLLKVGRRLSANYNINIDRAKPSAKSDYGISLNMSYNSTHNAVIDSTVYDASGKSIVYLLNGNGQNDFNLNGDIHFSTKFKTKYQLQAKYSPTYTENNSPAFINGAASASHNTTFGNTLSASFIVIDKFNTTIAQSITMNKNNQAGALNISPTIKNYTTSIDASYYLTKKWVLSSNLNYQSNRAQTNGSNAALWNATTTYRLMKDKAEIKFTAFDILRQNKNITNFLNQNSVGTTVTNGLRQYFMLSFSFYPRKFGGNNNSNGSMMIIRN